MRLGVVSYLNAVPLVHGLDTDRRFELVRDVPAQVACLLHTGRVDLGLIPSIEHRPGYRVVPGIAIASRGAVRSVLLLHRVALERVRRVALDASSRTSAALARILLRERLGREVEYVTLQCPVAEMLDVADAALVIGDRALYYDGRTPRLDLGEEWTRLTGLPFVYAFWAGREGAATDADVERLQQAAAAGLGALGPIASAYDGLGAGRAALSEAYLRDNIVYAFGTAEQAGLQEFYRRAQRIGLLEDVPELRFHGHP